MTPRLWLIPVQPARRQLKITTEVLRRHVGGPVVEGPEALGADPRDAPPDVALLHGGTAGARMIEALRTLVTLQVPTLVLVEALTDPIECLLLDRGARDVLPLPITAERLGSRVEAMIRSLRTEPSWPRLPALIQIGRDMEILPLRRSVTISGVEVALTKSEFDLLTRICLHPGEVVTLAELSAALEQPLLTRRALESHVSRLRGKLRGAGAHGQVRAARGVGYWWSEDEETGPVPPGTLVRMTTPAPVPPDLYPEVDGLDRLELHRWGVIPEDLLALPPGPVRLVDAQGVPVADLDAGGTLSWRAPRSPRPYERFHRPPGALAGPVSLVDDPARLPDVPTDTGPLVVLASTDGDDNEAELSLVRAARRRAEEIGAALVIAPLGRRAPGRSELLSHVRQAYGSPGTRYDLSSLAPSPAAGGRGLVVLFTGLSGSGKSTIATALHHQLVEETSRPVTLLDGDVVRRHLSKGLSFSAQDRDVNVRRIGWVAAEIARHGGIAIACPIAPFAASREAMRQMTQDRGGRFFLVHVDTPLEECERRDRKGLYAQARAGDLPDFTGITSPYEPPTDADLRLTTIAQDVTTLRDTVVQSLRDRGWLELAPEASRVGSSTG